MSRHLLTRNISSKSIYVFLSNLANRQTDERGQKHIPLPLSEVNKRKVRAHDDTRFCLFFSRVRRRACTVNIWLVLVMTSLTSGSPSEAGSSDLDTVTGDSDSVSRGRSLLPFMPLILFCSWRSCDTAFRVLFICFTSSLTL